MITFVVFGNLPRKSNSRQVFRNPRTKKIMFVKSKKARDFTDEFLNQVAHLPKNTFPEKTPLKLTATIYYQSNRSDLSDELLCDLLEKAEIIGNDRYIFEKVLYKGIDSENPRCEFKLEILPEK